MMMQTAYLTAPQNGYWVLVDEDGEDETAFVVGGNTLSVFAGIVTKYKGAHVPSEEEVLQKKVQRIERERRLALEAVKRQEMADRDAKETAAFAAWVASLGVSAHALAGFVSLPYAAEYSGATEEEVQKGLEHPGFPIMRDGVRQYKVMAFLRWMFKRKQNADTSEL